MLSKFLLPNHYKLIGWIISIPSLFLMLAVLHSDFSFSFLNYHRGNTGELRAIFGGETLFTMNANNFTDELGGVLLVTGLMLIAFSKEKDEDERILALRLESLLWAVLINSILLIIAMIFLYNGLFLQAMAYNVCTTLILFVARFNIKLYLERRNFKTIDL